MTIAMKPVTSKHAKAIGCDPNTGKLRMQFHSGAIWEYDNAAHHYQEMLKPGVSVGRYFHANIKDQHKGRKVET